MSFCFQLFFSFCGTDFHGWQNQPGCRTVQQTMEQILRGIFREDALCLNGCSRTDAGVHARRMAASFHSSSFLPAEELFSLLQKRLPHDIRILDVEQKPDFWNCHQAVCGKSYVYVIHPGGYALFLKDRVWNWAEPADMKKIAAALSLLTGEHDFQNFTGIKPDAASTVRTVWRAELIRLDGCLCLYLAGDGFLHKMVRRIAGLLYEINRETLSLSDFQNLLDTPGLHPLPDAVAPACGLYLHNIFFQKEEAMHERVERLPFLD